MFNELQTMATAGDVRLVRQAPYLNACGYSCLAMLTGLELGALLALVGLADEPIKSERLRLSYRKMRKLIAELEIESAPKQQSWSAPDDLPGTALISVDIDCRRRSRRRSEFHWMLFHEGQFYDPLADHPLRSVRRRPRHFIAVTPQRDCASTRQALQNRHHSDCSYERPISESRGE